MNWPQIAEILGEVCLVIGSVFVLIAAIGIRRFPDLLTRLHAAAKPQVVGLIFLMTGVALTVRVPMVIWTCVLVVLFQLITAPISAHMAARAGVRTGQVNASKLYVDEYRSDIMHLMREERNRDD
ncbi:MAG: monovalent cation/H(+) antiporter subunit G [Ruaniaceae bacterium]|mgnify:CR=1 FL=1|nr:monovalent cation/H(+) antiporter subunit G [Ruaniaceae bacterium]